MRPRHRMVASLHRMVVIAAVAALGVTAAACGGSSSSGGKQATGTTGSAKSSQFVVDFANINNESAFFDNVTKGVKQAAAVTGIKVNYYDNKSDGATTLSNARLMVQDHPNVIIEYYGDEGVAQAVENIFKQANIPCISANDRGAGGCKWFDLYNPISCGQTGTAMGKIAASRGWTAADTDVVLLAAASFGPEVNSCQGYYYLELQKYVNGLPKISKYSDISASTSKIGSNVFQINGDGLLDKAYNSMTNSLQAIPSSKHLIVYPIGDDMAVGALRALDKAGRSSNAMIAGVGGDAQSEQELQQNPTWVAEGDIFYSQWGEFLLAMASAINQHQSLPDLTLSPLAVETKDLTVPGTVITPWSKFYKSGVYTPSSLPPLIPVETTDLPGVNATGTVGSQHLAATGVLQKFHNVAGLS